MKRATRVRLLFFVVIGAIAIANAGVRYAGLGTVFSSGTYSVTVKLADSGGIFERAEVTLRGVTVGRVSDVHFRRDGVDVIAAIDSDFKIPSDLRAEVHNRSAVGEQYVDLIPSTDVAPYLANGDVIEEKLTSVPVDEDELLLSIDQFVRSLDVDDVATVVDELGVGFDGAGNDIQTIIDGSSTLIEALQSRLPETRVLLASGRIVLDTQSDQAQLISSYLGDLSKVTGVLSSQDGNVRTVLQDGASAADQVKQLTDGLSPGLQPLLHNLTDLAGIAFERQAGIEESLVAIPWALASAQTPGREGRAHFGLVLAQNPDACRVGYIPADKWRLPSETTALPAEDGIGCNEGYPAVPRGTPATTRSNDDLGRAAVVGGSSLPDSWIQMFALPPK